MCLTVVAFAALSTPAVASHSGAAWSGNWKTIYGSGGSGAIGLRVIDEAEGVSGLPTWFKKARFSCLSMVTSMPTFFSIALIKMAASSEFGM